MDEKITKREARKLLGARNDYQLSLALGIAHQAVYKWGNDDDPIPRQRVWQIKAMLAEKRTA